MILDEAIKHAEEVAEEKEKEAWEAQLQEEYKTIKSCKECAKEHRQLAEWLKELKQLRERTRWTPVSEGLPEKSTWVLVTCKNPDGYIFLDIKLINRYTELWDGDEDFIGTVLAWMPLPEPYKEEDRGGLEK